MQAIRAKGLEEAATMTSPVILPNATMPAASAVASVVNLIRGIKSQCNSYVTQLQTSTVNADQVLNVIQSMNNQINSLSALRDIPGLNAAATDATNGIPGYAGNLRDDIIATQNAMQGCINWVVTNIPKNASNQLLVYTINGDGTRVTQSFGPGATAGLVTALQAVLATIS